MITAVVGIQFGDEGKGKIVDFLSGRFHFVVRFNGGRNAGHTVVVGQEKYKFHLVPAGGLRTKNIVLANGMVIDPIALVDEIRAVQRVNPDLRIHISNKAHVVTELHRAIDRKEEELRGASKIGTTSQGIGPTYEDKYSRNGIRIEDLSSRSAIKEKLLAIRRMKGELLKSYSDADIERIAESLYNSGKSLEKYVEPTDRLLNLAWSQKKDILFEGANGALLDIDFGLFPYVTSSNTVAGFISCGAGLSFRKVDTVIGVMKGYVSKVGAGPFPTELSGSLADKLREAGHEYGTTTGRPRRVGWLDLPALRYSIRVSDIDLLAVTNLDTLGLMDKISLGESYVNRKTGEEITDPDAAHMKRIEDYDVKYRELKSWGEIDNSLRKEIVENGLEAMPSELKEYLKMIEMETGRKVGIISFGNRREYTIVTDSLKLPESR